MYLHHAGTVPERAFINQKSPCTAGTFFFLTVIVSVFQIILTDPAHAVEVIADQLDTEFRKKKPWVIDRSRRDGEMENGANDDKTLY